MSAGTGFNGLAKIAEAIESAGKDVRRGLERVAQALESVAEQMEER